MYSDYYNNKTPSLVCKFNKKLNLASRIAGQVAFNDIMNNETGEILVEKDSVISKEAAKEIQNSGINIVDVKVNDKKVRTVSYTHLTLPTTERG